MAANSGATPGQGVDAHGNPVIDPTANVVAILVAAVNRIDDLRDAAVKRQDDLRQMEAESLRREAEMRRVYDEQLREAESKRIDAIRAVDVGAVNRAAEVAATQAATLATQVAVSAETLRNQVQAAATASTIALNAALDPVQKAIDDLRKAQYEAQGQRAQVVDARGASGNVLAWIGGAVGLLGIAIATISIVLSQAGR